MGAIGFELSQPKLDVQLVEDKSFEIAELEIRGLGFELPEIEAVTWSQALHYQ